MKQQKYRVCFPQMAEKYYSLYPYVSMAWRRIVYALVRIVWHWWTVTPSRRRANTCLRMVTMVPPTPPDFLSPLDAGTAAASSSPMSTVYWCPIDTVR